MHQNCSFECNHIVNGSSKATKFPVKDSLVDGAEDDDNDDDDNDVDDDDDDDVLVDGAEDDSVPRFGLCLSSICAPFNFTRYFDPAGIQILIFSKI